MVSPRSKVASRLDVSCGPARTATLRSTLKLSPTSHTMSVGSCPLCQLFTREETPPPPPLPLRRLLLLLRTSPKLGSDCRSLSAKPCFSRSLAKLRNKEEQQCLVGEFPGSSQPIVFPQPIILPQPIVFLVWRERRFSQLEMGDGEFLQ